MSAKARWLLRLVLLIAPGCRDSAGGGASGADDAGVQGPRDDAGTPGPAVELRVEVHNPGTPISRYIYGADDQVVLNTSYLKMPKAGLVRAASGAWTTYNWENNAKNHGVDWGPNESTSVDIDGPGSTDTPGAAVVSRVTSAHNIGAAAVVSVSLTDYVAADKDGGVIQGPSATNPRWAKNNDTKPTALSMTPNLSDGTVYQDEFVNFIQQTFRTALAQGKKIFYSLDNEPGIWNEIHPLLHPVKPTFAEMAERTRRFGSMIKRHAPDALVFGMVAFGVNELMTLNDAPDQAGRLYVDFYLDMIKGLETSAGKRIVDVIDVHWYSEVVADGIRISDLGTSGEVLTRMRPNPSAAEIEARVQNPRSLWDPAYVENSWIVEGGYQDFDRKPIRLIPWLKEKIAARYPETKLAITEYNYGDGIHISHAIAHADALGIFGREGVFAAAFFPLAEPFLGSYIQGAFDMFLDYDGKGSAVGDVSVPVQNPDVARLSAYAMKSSNNPTRLHLVLLNKTGAEIATRFALTDGGWKTATAFVLAQGNLVPRAAGPVDVGSGDALTATLPPLSVTTIEIKK